MRAGFPDDSAEGLMAGMRIANSANDVAYQRTDELLDRLDVDALLRHLIPTLLPLGGFPENPDEVAIEFLLGCCVADAEAAEGLAKPGSISNAAAMAMGLLRRTPPGEPERAPATWRFLDLGYCCHRLALSPQQASAAVLAPRS